MDGKMIDISQQIKKANKYEDLYNVIWRSCEKDKLEKKHYHNISIGLFNVPCGGFNTDYECVQGQCIPFTPGQFTGPTAQADCQAQCGGGATEYCIDCQAQIMNYVPNTINCPTCTSCNSI